MSLILVFLNVLLMSLFIVVPENTNEFMLMELKFGLNSKREKNKCSVWKQINVFWHNFIGRLNRHTAAEGFRQNQQNISVKFSYVLINFLPESIYICQLLWSLTINTCLWFANLQFYSPVQERKKTSVTFTIQAKSEINPGLS